MNELMGGGTLSVGGPLESDVIHSYCIVGAKFCLNHWSGWMGFLTPRRRGRLGGRFWWTMGAWSKLWRSLPA